MTYTKQMAINAIHAECSHTEDRVLRWTANLGYLTIEDIRDVKTHLAHAIMPLSRRNTYEKSVNSVVECLDKMYPPMDYTLGQEAAMYIGRFTRGNAFLDMNWQHMHIAIAAWWQSWFKVREIS